MGDEEAQVLDGGLADLDVVGHRREQQDGRKEVALELARGDATGPTANVLDVLQRRAEQAVDDAWNEVAGGARGEGAFAEGFEDGQRRRDRVAFGRLVAQQP